MSDETSWSKKFFGILGDQLQDLSYISVVTGTGDTYAEIDPSSNNIIKELENQKVKIVARTYMELDGDITMILPTKQSPESNEIDKELMEIHRQNTDIAVRNWNSFVGTVVDIAKVVGGMLGLSTQQIATNFGSLNVPVAET